MSVRNKPQVFNEPAMFAAISVKGMKNGAKVLEGQVPEWKFFGQRGTGNGAAGSTFGLPRFKNAEFITEFPFCTINLRNSDVPLKVQIKGWSPFIPTDEDNSSLPVRGIEYKFVNNSTAPAISTSPERKGLILSPMNCVPLPSLKCISSISL